MSSVWRAARCCWLELLLLAVAAAMHAVADNRGAVAGALCASFAGVCALWRCGELPLAWRAPAVDALGVRVVSSSLPWDTLAAGEAILERFGSRRGAAYRSFFPTLRSELRSVMQAVVDAPEQRLALHARLRRVLADLEVFDGGRAPPDALATLQLLEERASALASAVSEVHGSAREGVMP